MTLTPYEQARAVYLREPCKRTFDEDLLLHFVHGFVFSTPEYFVMGRPVVSTEDPSEILNPAIQFDRSRCNCWHIYLASGDVAKAWSVMPWRLGWFSWERRNELRIYPVERIRRLSTGHLPLNMP